MSDLTREQAYRRWKKGEDQHALAKEMGVTRERMRHILKNMDENVPLVDRIEALEAANARMKVQIWNDAVKACWQTAWEEVQTTENDAANGMPDPARSVVRAIGGLIKQGDERQTITMTTDELEGFPRAAIQDKGKNQ